MHDTVLSTDKFGSIDQWKEGTTFLLVERPRLSRIDIPDLCCGARCRLLCSCSAAVRARWRSAPPPLVPWYVHGGEGGGGRASRALDCCHFPRRLAWLFPTILQNQDFIYALRGAKVLQTSIMAQWYTICHRRAKTWVRIAMGGKGGAQLAQLARLTRLIRLIRLI